MLKRLRLRYLRYKREWFIEDVSDYDKERRFAWTYGVMESRKAAEFTAKRDEAARKLAAVERAIAELLMS